MDKKGYNAFAEWEAFCSYLIKDNRFILNEEWGKFVEKIITFAHKNEKKLDAKQQYWRARIAKGFKRKGDRFVANSFTKDEMGAPPREKTKDGRANPKGIPYLYLSDEPATAIAEVRPYLNAEVTLALFELKKQIKVIDLFENTFPIMALLNDPESTPKDEEILLWTAINFYFSASLTPNNELIYIPTQYISELFKNNGYDGIIFGSAQKKGKRNLVLFSPCSTEIKKIEQRLIKDIGYIDHIEYTKRSLSSQSTF